MTQNCLTKRLTQHLNHGSILEHFWKFHNTPLTKKILKENTLVIERANERHELAIKEALLILQHKPTINIQNNNFDNVLKLNYIKHICNKEKTCIKININKITINTTTKTIMKITS